MIETREKIAIISAVLFLILILSACAPAKVVTEYRDRYITKTELRIDSVWRDRWHTEYTRNDTVYIHDSVWVDRLHTDVRVDTVHVRDSIPYQVEVTREVRVRNGYDKFTARGFWALLAIISLSITIWLLTKTKYGKLVYKTILYWVRS